MSVSTSVCSRRPQDLREHGGGPEGGAERAVGHERDHGVPAHATAHAALVPGHGPRTLRHRNGETTLRLTCAFHPSRFASRCWVARCCITACGMMCIAQATAPIGRNSLVFGSDDAGSSLSLCACVAQSVPASPVGLHLWLTRVHCGGLQARTFTAPRPNWPLCWYFAA